MGFEWFIFVPSHVSFDHLLSFINVMFYKLLIPRKASTVRGQHRPRPPNGASKQNKKARFITPKQNKHDERVEARDLIIAKRPRRR